MLAHRKTDINVISNDQKLGPVAKSGGKTEKVHVSYEFFPPKNEKMEKTLWESIQKRKNPPDSRSYGKRNKLKTCCTFNMR